jgi:two-component sensor histidine kinase
MTICGQFHNAAARVAAIAAVHQQLHSLDDVGTVALDRYLIELCQGIAAASSSPDRALVVDADPLIIYTDMAVPLALIVNELITNAIRHATLGERDAVRVSLRACQEHFSISVSDPGDGPVATEVHAGLGTRIIETLARQISAAVAKERLAAGYTVTVTVPHRESAWEPR